ncbi:hypothetical protein B0T24DRAFT_718641 [Lasiosphaeria ovina]|uniref:CBM1 domain-containing protein n=1 Tax=Lasiosphaeria ovina TaxID=92902 RepID=A0AAE0KGS1_9PEZI|nr:hypothetical protein B0T24DRAFT_718641 [Lasiosphaeria ovina]
MASLKHLVLALAAVLAPGVSGRQLQRRDASANDPYPFCNPATSPDCIEGGKYVKPDLDFSDQNDVGDVAYRQYLSTHTFTLSQWTNGKIPEACYYWAVTADHWNAADFVVYNVTFSDCPTPFVVCYNNKSPKTVSEIATEISRIPIGMRQATSMYVVYGDQGSDNPSYTGYMATACWDGIIIGRSSGYFTTSLVHETGHAVDCTLASPDASHPASGSSFSGTAAWHSAADTDGYAVTAYGTGNYAEDFADVGRAVLLDNIYPGGLSAWSNNNPNLTQIAHQLAAFEAVAGAYYVAGGTCDVAKKFPFPTNLVSVGTPTTTTTSAANLATATPYGQCGGWSTYTGATLCGSGYTCTTLNPYYAQCTPTPGH